jgi:hypothetical protein
MRDGSLEGHSLSTANELGSIHNSAGINAAGTFCVCFGSNRRRLRMSIGRTRPNKISPGMSVQLARNDRAGAVTTT